MRLLDNIATKFLFCRPFAFPSSLLSIMVLTILFIGGGLFPALLANANFVSPLLLTFQQTADHENVKPVGDFRKDVKAFVKRSKNNEDTSQRIGAIVDLCLLHDQLVRDPRFQSNTQLQGFRAITADRLKKCRREIELEMKRAARVEEKIANTEKSKNRGEQPESDNHWMDAESDSDQIPEEFLQQWLFQDMQAITQISGGPIRCWGYTGGNYAGPLCDLGPDLVRLIETTINPDFWRSNGGTGVIHYYQPLRILVVSASSQVHSEMTDLLRTIRSNSR